MTILKNQGPAPLKKLGALALVIALFWGTLIVYTIQVNVPKNIVELPAQEHLQRIIVPLLPQGWSFFTRPPREAVYLPYTVDNDVTELNAGPYSKPGAAFGIDRGARAQNIELGILASQLPENSWQECEGYLAEDCIDPAAQQFAVENTLPSPTLCGDVFFLQREPVPWVWSEHSDSKERFISSVRTNIAC